MQNNCEGITNTCSKFYEALRELINSLLDIILSKDFVLLRACSKNFFRNYFLQNWTPVAQMSCVKPNYIVDQGRIEAYRTGSLIMEETGF